MKLIFALLAAAILPSMGEAATVPVGKSKFQMEASGDCYDRYDIYYACFGGAMADYGGGRAEFTLPANVKVISAYVGIKTYKGPKGYITDDKSFFYTPEYSSLFYGLFYLPNDKNFKWIEPLFNESKYNEDTSAGGKLEYEAFPNISENPGSFTMTYEFRFELERISAVPLPAAFPLLLGAVTGLVAHGRKKRSRTP